MRCKLFNLTLQLLLKLRTQDDSQQSRTMQARQEKATLRQLEEALRKHCIEHVQRDFA
jgi:hypothetical protein